MTEDHDRRRSGESELDYLKRKRDQYITAIPICVALLGFVAYGCWQLGATREVLLMVFPVPALMLVIYIIAIISTVRKIHKLLDDDVA
jgi:formate hydrogenlyase subunit 4